VAADWRDYEWAEEDWLFYGVCISVAAPGDVEGLISEIADVAVTERCDFDRLEQLGAGAPATDGKAGDAIGLLQAGPGVVMVEPYGGLMEEEPFASPLSRTKDVVSYYIGGHGRGSFKWYAHGELRCAFDHDTPGSRRGSDPDSVLPLMEQIGGFMPFDDDAEVPETVHTTGAVMALMESISGIRVTYALLRDSEYSTALVRPQQ